jgi:hypothetical protein
MKTSSKSVYHGLISAIKKQESEVSEQPDSSGTDHRGMMDRRNAMKIFCKVTESPCRLAIFGLVVVITLLSAGAGYGQTPADNTAAPLLWKTDPIGMGATFPTSCSPFEDRNGPLLYAHPLLESAGVPGWFGDAEVGVVVPHVMNRLFETVTRASGASSTVQLPSAQIDAAVMPRFEFGYRFGEAAGELLVSYRFLLGQATNFASADIIPAFAHGAPVTSRLNLQTIDLDYGSSQPRTVLGVDMKWRVGVRCLLEFNDSQADNGTLFQSTSNNYVGFGPHAMVDFRRPIEGTGLAWFGRVEMAMVFGSLNQNYTDSVTTAGVTDSGVTRDSVYGQVTSLAVQLGMSWTPEWNRNINVTAGYIFEHYWDLGTGATGTASREELDIQGGFVRVEWRY